MLIACHKIITQSKALTNATPEQGSTPWHRPFTSPHNFDNLDNFDNFEDIDIFDRCNTSLIGGVQGTGHSPPLIWRPAPPQRATNGRKVKPTSLCMKGTEWCQYLVMSSRNNAENVLKYLGIFKDKFSWLTWCPQPTQKLSSTYNCLK